MRIVCNGMETELEVETTLQKYLQDQALSEKAGIAIAINESVVPRNDWKDTVLRSGDSIIIIKATQGG